MLVIEMMEKAFEMRLLHKKEESLSEDSKFIKTEEITRSYTKKGKGKLREEVSNVVVRNLEGKEVSSSLTSSLFSTDEQGNVVGQNQFIGTGPSRTQTGSLEYRLRYSEEEKPVLLSSQVRNSTRSEESGAMVDCINRTAYQYDELGKIKIVINDCVPAEGTKFIVGGINFLQIWVMEYGDDGNISSIDLVDADTCNNDYKCRRYIVKYDGDGYVRSIQALGSKEHEGEFFSYNGDKVTVIQNKYAEDGTVTAKTVQKRWKDTA